MNDNIIHEDEDEAEDGEGARGEKKGRKILNSRRDLKEKENRENMAIGKDSLGCC